MPKQPETIFLEKVDKDLTATFGEDIEIFNIQQKSKVGDPDRLICLKGHFLALEGKIEGGRTNTIQIIKLLKVKRAGGTAYRIYPHSWEETLEEIKKIYASL